MRVTSTRPAWIAGLATTALVLVPGASSWGLPGVPLDGWLGAWWLDGAALLVCAATLCLPRRWPTDNPPSTSSTRILRSSVLIATLLSVIGIILKCLLLLIPAPGFAVCLQLPAIPPGQDCERSWAYPTSDVTRIDTTVDIPVSSGLGASTWGLSSANATEYNYFNPAQPNRDRLAIRGTWQGRVVDSGSPLAITYVGEGTVTVDGDTLPLPAAYREPVTLALPAGSDITIDFAWRSTATNADGPQTTPYASLRLTTADGRAAVAADPSRVSRVLAVAVMTITVMTLGILGVLIIGFLWRRRSTIRAAIGRSPVGSGPWAWLLLAGSIIAILAMARLQAAAIYPVGIIVLLLTLSALLRATPTAVVRVLACLAIGAAALAMTVSLTRDSPLVTLRSGGSDPLTYEGQAHTLLTTGSLHGGESIFIYSPGFRYLIALQHLVVGDGDRAFVTVGIAGLLSGCVFACWWLQRPLRIGAGRVPLTRLGSVVIAVCLLGLLVGSPDVLLGSRTLLSEYPTWIALLFIVPLVLVGHRGWPLAVAGLLIGVTLTMRGDQVLGLLTLLGIALVRQWGPGRLSAHGSSPVATTPLWWRWPAITAGAFVLPAILPAIHNVIYGRQLVLLQTSIPLPVNFPLPPSVWPSLLHDAATQQTLIEQLAGVFVVFGVHPEGITSMLFLLAVRGIQAALVVTVLIAAWRRFSGGWRRVAVVALPLTFLLPHIAIQVYVYYPRHIVAGYLVAGVSLLALAGWSTRRDQPADAAA